MRFRLVLEEIDDAIIRLAITCQSGGTELIALRHLQRQLTLIEDGHILCIELRPDYLVCRTIRSDQH